MAKVIMAWPPITDEKGRATHAQNRQYQYFKDPTYIYPVIPATFITMLITTPGNEVLWVDAVAEELSEKDFAQLIAQMQPDYIVLEANTMLIKQYYEYVNTIKETFPNIKIILTGEHVTALPDEAKEMCKADYFLKGGKWYNEAYKIITGNKVEEDATLPVIDRTASRWWLYAYKNGNFKYVPATYMMAAQDCWYRPKKPCTFCTWVDYHPENKIRKVDDYIYEVENLVSMGFKEYFDDSGTFPVGKWLREYCQKMTEKKYDINGKMMALSDLIVWGCNMRFGALQKEDFKLMADAGCRFILWGYESSDRETLDLLCKGYPSDARIKEDLRTSSDLGIWNHLTTMFGYPWCELETEKKSCKDIKKLLIEDYASSAQATIFMPYPGTEAFRECKEKGLILHEEWNRWDMTEPVIKLKYQFEEALKLQKSVYNVYYHPKFIFNKLKKIRSWDDFRFYFRLGKKVVDRFGNVLTARGVNDSE